MPTSQKKKRKQKAKHITARSITLTDAKGKTRILMNAGDVNGYSSICLFGENGRSIQISTQPDGGLSISLYGQRCTASAALVMTADEDAGLSISNRQGELGTVLGSTFRVGEHGLALFREGKPYWRMPKPSKQKIKTKRR